jgi:hypothetical protein
MDCDSWRNSSPLTDGFGMFKWDNRNLEFAEISAHCPQSL